MLSHKNLVVLASAGSRKSTFLVERALADPSKRTLLCTYTNENVAQLREFFIARLGMVPRHVTIIPWFSFLLRDGVRPYQASVCPGPRIASLYFKEIPFAATRVPKASPQRYFLTRDRLIYRDRIADFVCCADAGSGGAVIRRLEGMFDQILIDEVQDFAGYDLDILESLFKSTTEVTCVGDLRQSTYQTNNSARHKQFRGAGILNWFRTLESKSLITMEERTECYRSNQAICDFADQVFPALPRTVSHNVNSTGHDGIFEVPSTDVGTYFSVHRPVVLRNDRRSKTAGLDGAINFGVSKGRTFDRVLIFPTASMRKYLQTKRPEDLGDKARFYVAVTRARFSVAFVVD